MGAAGADRLGAQLENIGGVLYAQGWMLIGTHKKSGIMHYFPAADSERSIAQDATLIEAARAKYAELSYTKKGLQTFFLSTLLVATLFGHLFGAGYGFVFCPPFCGAGIVVGRGRAGSGSG